jgi:hypothetical protein
LIFEDESATFGPAAGFLRVKLLTVMNRTPPPPDDSWETDAVWKLLDQAQPKAAGARFADDTVRTARLSVETKSWWSRLFSPAPLAGLAAATTALAFAVISLVGPAPTAGIQTAVLDSPQAVAIQDIAETETLIAAADHLDDFSDNELVSLIGF